MIILDREELVKKKGNLDLPEINLNINELKNLENIINLLVDIVFDNINKE